MGGYHWRLNLGAGRRWIPGYINVDLYPEPADRPQGMVYVQWDLDTPWPWEDDSAQIIEARDIFEHVDNAILFMTECWRVLEPGALLHIHTPYWRSPDAFTDPTHKRFPTEHTFDYWILDTLLYKEHNRAYGGVAFRLADMHPDGGSLDVTLLKIPPEENGDGGQAGESVRMREDQE